MTPNPLPELGAALLAAGLGERLQAAHPATPKPLVPVAGRPLIDHALAALEAAGLRRVACVVNETSGPRIEAHCRTRWPGFSFTFVSASTPNSMESLFALSPFLVSSPFLLLTADAVFPPVALPRFLAAARSHDGDGVMAITDHVDDERPLWVGREGDRVVTLGEAAAGSGWVTAGIFLLQPRLLQEIEAARARRLQALRQFLGHLVERGYRLQALPFGACVDVDRPEDIAPAEQLLRDSLPA